LPSGFGSREENLRAAIRGISKLGAISRTSTFFDTEPVGFLDQPRFLNAALLLETALTAQDLMRELLTVERSMGRQREGVPAKGPRVIDLDLIWVDNLVLNTEALTLPHPAMHERRFVLEPLAELAPDWVHPRLGSSVAEMLDRLRSIPKATR
jgi:2-amino-4-hydroxy-6-hydroxymethyldihydropteridine diphosphokinase